MNESLKEVRGSRVRNGQRGSVATFLLVGLVLAVVAIGGISYIQKQNGDNGNTPKRSPIAITTSPTPKTTPNKPEKIKKPQVGESAPTLGRQGTVPMPKTGPSDTIFSILMMGLLAGLAVAYIRSARSVRDTSLD